MSANEYWYGEPNLTKYYRDAFELKKEQENEKLWLQGLYIYEALCKVSPVLNAFAKKGTKPIAYSTKPYALSEKENKKREIQEQYENTQRLKAFLMKGVKK